MFSLRDTAALVAANIATLGIGIDIPDLYRVPNRHAEKRRIKNPADLPKEERWLLHRTLVEIGPDAAGHLEDWLVGKTASMPIDGDMRFDIQCLALDMRISINNEIPE